ncbi:hypothetical protein BHM03_00057849 [Ensete ventricosum]|nr:hypothetical protein BHM03_00057849 [Ensete ventricosum]
MPSPPSPSLRRRRRCHYAGDGCPFRPTIALPRGGHPYDRRLQTRSQTIGAAGAPTGKKNHKERLTMVETHLDVLEVSLEELYQGQRRLLGVESSLEEAES